MAGPLDTPAIVTGQANRPDAVRNPGFAVKLTARRGVPYPCDPSGDSDPDLTVLRVSCRSALRLFRLVYGRGVKHGTASAEGLRCRYDKHTAIPGMGGGEVACRGRDHHGRPRVADIFHTPPR